MNIRQSIVEKICSGGAGKAKVGCLDRRWAGRANGEAVVPRMAFEIDQDVDVVVANKLSRLGIAVTRNVAEKIAGQSYGFTVPAAVIRTVGITVNLESALVVRLK